MTTKVYDKDGRQIVQFSPGAGSKPRLEIWANPWQLDTEQAKEIGKALLRWAWANESLPEKTCQQCFHDYAPSRVGDDGFCSDSCMEQHDRELADDVEEEP